LKYKIFTISILSILFFSSCSNSKKMFNWQGHRGARGLVPENTIPAFLKAMSYNEIQTLEMDVCISQDRKVVVSHEPWFSPEICSHPDGKPFTEAERDQYLIFNMTYNQIKIMDCGQRGHARFPEQIAESATKPLLEDVVQSVEKNQLLNKNRQKVYYNIEQKSDPRGDDKYHPNVDEFTHLVMDEIKRLNIKDRTTFQSFDVRALELAHRIDKYQTIALLVENKEGLEANLKKLTFIPNIYSPDFHLLTKEDVQYCHKKGIKVIPWTVNEIADIKAIKALGVDGIITDYPNRISSIK
jgi:glycerophosphoryl diester phosphodiesterase